MAIEIEDTNLEDSVQGQFYLAIAEAVDALEIEPLASIRIIDFPVMPRNDGPELFILPMPEQPSPNPRLGLYNQLLSARLVMIERFDEQTRQGLGWHTKQRERLIRRLGGQTAEGAYIGRAGYCFELKLPTTGPLLDEAAKAAGLCRSELYIHAGYHGA